LEDEYGALRKYCFDKELMHSSFIKELILDKLKKEKYFEGK